MNISNFFEYKLREINFDEFKNIFKQYIRQDFPFLERKPLWTLKKNFSTGKNNACVLERDGSLKAYASFTSENKEIILLDYFAVTKEARGEGVGSLFLQLLKNNLAAKGIIECENPEDTKSSEEKRLITRRVDFYVNAGATLLDYRLKILGIEYVLLYLPISASKDEINLAKELSLIFDNMYPLD
ncbi:GNAT family N-acetyltransferase [Neisseriaceae bacterium PsAf]|nr:GNAT family N-acetyltransferase [Neisseriaceae bacterium PsAf]